MKRKGFTLVELLVVIAIIALLMSILMPALARVRELAQRVVCGTNCSGIVKAMLVYGNDTETGRFPRAGGIATTWGSAVDINAQGVWTSATISSSLYLLIAFDYTSAKQFVCKSDPLVSEFKGGNAEDFVDFGSPVNHNSYAYHMPYAGTNNVSYVMSGASDTGMAVIADRNPFVLVVDPQTQELAKLANNSENHQGDGQNVAYVDAHVKFMDTPACGQSEDNIYSVGNPDNYQGIDSVGILAAVGQGPAGISDSLVVNER